MQTAFLDYDLPVSLIAQHPTPERDRSRLLVVNRRDQTLAHHLFADLPDLLMPADFLVLNDTRVLPARLLGRRVRTGGRWEGLFLGLAPDGTWEVLCKTRGRLVEGERIKIEPGPLQLTLVRKSDDGHWLVHPEVAGTETAGPSATLERFGNVPLPPYIRKGLAEDSDRERYQTVFARHPGAVAAPTAGLHFTERLFERLASRSIGRTFVTLHVGPGTFQPVQSDKVEDHHMHREWGELSSQAAAEIAAYKKRGGRAVAVGTTAVRVLETVAASGPLRPWSGETGLYIYPPYPFRATDALITNFHLPRSTLLLLVSAFAGIELTRQAYMTAIEHEYRFYSYGDAMLVF